MNEGPSVNDEDRLAYERGEDLPTCQGTTDGWLDRQYEENALVVMSAVITSALLMMWAWL